MQFVENNGQITKNFKASEFKCKCGCGKIYIAKELVDKLQQLREHYGKSITVSSGYRCPVHNKNVGSDNTSPHLMGVAADISVSGVPSKDVAVIAEQLGFDGIALITDSYIHLDLKGRRWLADERTGKTFKTFQPEEKTKEPNVTTTPETPMVVEPVDTPRITHKLEVLLDGEKVFEKEI